MTMRGLYDKYGLDEGTRTFTGRWAVFPRVCASRHHPLPPLPPILSSIPGPSLPPFSPPHPSLPPPILHPVTHHPPGHAMALQLNDTYLDRPALETVKAIKLYCYSLERWVGG